jgi:hypothetical protein
VGIDVSGWCETLSCCLSIFVSNLSPCTVVANFFFADVTFVERQIAVTIAPLTMVQFARTEQDMIKPSKHFVLLVVWGVCVVAARTCCDSRGVSFKVGFTGVNFPNMLYGGFWGNA